MTFRVIFRSHTEARPYYKINKMEAHTRRVLQSSENDQLSQKNAVVDTWR